MYSIQRNSSIVICKVLVNSVPSVTARELLLLILLSQFYYAIIKLRSVTTKYKKININFSQFIEKKIHFFWASVHCNLAPVIINLCMKSALYLVIDNKKLFTCMEPTWCVYYLTWLTRQDSLATKMGAL